MTILAYIDPGSGTLLLQALIAGLLGAFAYFRRTLFGFLGFFKGKPKDQSSAETEDNSKPK